MSTTTLLPTQRLSDEEQAAELRASQARINAEYARQLELIAKAVSGNLAATNGYRSTAAFLSRQLRISLQQAKTRVAQATMDLPLTRKTLAAGDITPEHAHAIAYYLAQAPATLDLAQYRAYEESLVTLSRQANSSVVAKLGRRLKAYWDDDVPAPDDRHLARPHREFRYSWTRNGRLHFSGDVDPETAKLVADLMVPLAKPDPVDEHGNTDPRTATERQGDAFATIVDLAARAPELPVNLGERATGTKTNSHEELRGNTGTAHTSQRNNGHAKSRRQAAGLNRCEKGGRSRGGRRSGASKSAAPTAPE